MKNIVIGLTLAALAWGPSAVASDGSMTMDFGTFNAGFSMEKQGNKITGSQENLGTGSGRISLENKNGFWEGHFGFNRVQVRSFRVISETKTNMEFTVLPGGHYTATVEKTDKGYSVRLSTPSTQAYANVQEARLSIYNRWISSSLELKTPSFWEGSITVQTSRGFDYSQTQISAYGELMPMDLLAKDPALFAIFYMLPTNFTR